LRDLELSDIDKYSTDLSLFPHHRNIHTTKKKRTILQPQTRKANELVEKCIDMIMTNYVIDYSACDVGEINEIDL
jgi:hypothetical protein